MMKFLSFPFKAGLLLLTLLLGAGIQHVMATHIAALDMNVKYIGAGQDGCSGTTEYKYQITVKLYTACEPNSATGGGGTLEYWSDNAGIPRTNIPLEQVPNQAGSNTDPDTVHSLCEAYSQSNSCKNRANQHLPGFFLWTYVQNITLPTPQTDWKFAFYVGARNDLIANLPPNNGETAYIECMLDNFTKYNNSTPVFEFNPLPYICRNTDYEYFNNPISYDGDSIRVFKQVTYNYNFGGNPTPSVYRPGFDIVNPLRSTTGYRVDSNSGTAYFNVPNVGKYVLGFRMNEYEPGSGKLISYVMRDVQVSVLDCTAPPPYVDSMPQNLKNATVVKNCVGDKKGYYIYGCPGSKISFDVRSIPDASNPNNNIWMYRNGTAMPGSTFRVTNDGSNHPVATFEWTPTNRQYGDYNLLVTGADSTCSPTQPIVLRTTKSFQIRIARGLDAGPDLKFCDINRSPVQLFAKGAQCLNVQWTNLDGSAATSLLPNARIENPVDTLAAPYKNHGFVVFSSDLVGACKNRDTVMVEVDTTNTIRIAPNMPNTNDFVLCRPDYVQLDAVIKGPRPLSNFACGTGNPINCTKPDSLFIYGSPTYGANISYDTLGTTTPVFPNYEVQTAKQQFYISKGDLWEMGLRSSTIKGLAFYVDSATAPTHPYENFTIKMKCTPKESLSKADGFENFMTPVYTSTGQMTFGKGIHRFTFDAPYTWDTTQNLIIEFCYANSTFISVCNGATGTAPIIRFVPTEGVGTLYLKGAVNQTSVCNVNTSPDIQELPTRPLFKFAFCEADNIPFKFVWSPGVFLSDSTIQQPLAYVPKSINYVVETFGRSSCLVRDTIKIYVPEHDYKLTGDTTICFGEQAVMSVNDGFDFKWYEYKDGKFLDAHGSVSCVQCKDVILTPKATTTYKVVVYDSVWCLDTVTATVTVLPLPDVHILTSDTVIKYGQSIKLLASGARMYNWMPVTGLSNANTSYPTATPLESTQYVLGGIGSNGCKAYDTVLVSIDNRDNLFISSAFSPNGDGKNDLFRIANLTFQRVLEFRVFNRWGQEVYNNNSNSGWDGTWKGVPQDMGNYSYQIRIGFPDGYVESYKGEVTLVR